MAAIPGGGGHLGLAATNAKQEKNVSALLSLGSAATNIAAVGCVFAGNTTLAAPLYFTNIALGAAATGLSAHQHFAK